MSGIYIHIPYCKQACHYCNFHFSTSLQSKSQVLEAIGQELVLRKEEVPQTVSTLYFGGGTPSILEENELKRIFDSLTPYLEMKELEEVTLEANPDDITPEKLKLWKTLGIDRLSIGLQSFFQEDLEWMNRAHTAKEAKNCFASAAAHGFEKLTVDLIYGYPLLTDEKWLKNLELVKYFGVDHFSAYALTVEDNTALAHQLNSGKQEPVNEEQAAHQFELLMQWAAKNGYEHYEISNFARNGKYAIHNTNYWKGQHYLGLGPAAHSYSGKRRTWNIANNQGYINSVSKGELANSFEELSENDRYNEYIMTGLRTKWGVELGYLEKNFPPEMIASFLEEVKPYLASGHVKMNNAVYTLDNNGKLLADRIMSDLFYTIQEEESINE